MTRSSELNMSSDPSARTEPSCRTVTLTSSSRTKLMSCSTTTIERSPAMDLSSAAVVSVSASVMRRRAHRQAAVSVPGPAACRSRAIASGHARGGGEHIPLHPSLTMSSSSSRRVFSAEDIRQNSASPTLRLPASANARFSDTVSFSKHSASGTCGRYRAQQSLASSRRVRSRVSANSTSPVSGRVLR